MALTDTAEYWNDIKDSFNRHKHVFTHKSGLYCGHFHVYESKKFAHIDCYACLKILEYTNPQYKEWKENIDYHKCSCGGLLKERTNTKTNETFLGCSKFPKCKITKPTLKR